MRTTKESTKQTNDRLFQVVQQLTSEEQSAVLCWLCGWFTNDKQFAKALDRVLFTKFPDQYKKVVLAERGQA